MTWLAVAKVTVVLLLAWLALAGLRQAPAALRHLVVVTGLLAALSIPFLAAALPAWQIVPRPLLSQPLDTGERHSAPLLGRSAISADRAVAPAATPRLTPAPPASASHSRFTVKQLLSLAWCAGFAGLLLLFLMRCTAMAALVRRARPCTDRAWCALLQQTRRELGIRQPVDLKLRAANAMPMVWGWRRPVVLLPADSAGWPPARRRDVLAHELAHIRRRDVATLTIGHLACALHWFNPLVWMLKRRLGIEAELACDDLALAHGSSASQYADHLLVTACGYRNRHTLAPVMAAPSQLEGRIMAILDNHRVRGAVTRGALTVTITLAAVLLVPLAAVSWADDDAMSPAPAGGQDGYRDSDSSWFARHLRSLGIAGDDVDALLAGLTAADPLTRGASAWALGSVADERVIDPLIAAAGDPVALVRQWAVRSLGQRDAARVAATLILRLADADTEVRQWAVRGLAVHADAIKTQPLIATLNDGDPEVREWAARVLAKVADPTVATALGDRLTIESDAAAAEWLVRALGERNDPRSIPALIAALRHPSAEVREWTVRSLAGFDDPAIVEPLIGTLADEDAEVREWAVRSLANVEDPRATAALAGRASVETNAETGQWLVRALADRDGARSTAALRAALYNDDADVRQWAVRGLDGVRDDQTVDALIAMLNDGDAEVREWSVRVLGYCGNRRAAGALQALRGDPDAEVREWVDRALENIDC